MNYLQLHILCNRDTRTAEDLALEQQFASMEIPLKTSGEEKVIQEWRVGLINASHISCVYPHAIPAHTLIHLHAGSVITVLESYAVVVACLNQSAGAVGVNGYSYSLIQEKPTLVKPPNATPNI